MFGEVCARANAIIYNYESIRSLCRVKALKQKYMPTESILSPRWPSKAGQCFDGAAFCLLP